MAANTAADVAREFGLHGPPRVLPGGSVAVSLVGDVVLKQISETSLENDYSPQLAAWIAEFSATLPQIGFRVPQGVPTADGRWITEAGWTGWTFVEGAHAGAADIPACIQAIQALNRGLSAIPKHRLMEQNSTAWGQAHRMCLGDAPVGVAPVLRGVVDELYSVREPVHSEFQLIHGDLNPENILVAPQLPPAFIDFSPFWGPPELAIAIFANWIGPRAGDASVLPLFRDVPDFDQMLIRAAMRMVLVVDVLQKHREIPDDEWANSSEKRAADIVLDYVAHRN